MIFNITTFKNFPISNGKFGNAKPEIMFASK